MNVQHSTQKVRFPPTSHDPIVEHATHYAAQNRWPVLVVNPDTKIPYKSAALSNGARWGQTTNSDEIRKDFERWPNANVGIATGADSGIFVVETDTAEGHGEGTDGAAALAALEAEHGPLPLTLEAESPSGSIHRYYRHPGFKIKNSGSLIGPGIDVRGDGGMVVAPPSNKPGKGVYVWRNQLSIADAPQWLLDRIVAGKERPEPELSISQQAIDKLRPPVNPFTAYGEWCRNYAGGNGIGTDVGFSRAYLDSALDGERAMVASASKGGRNAQLNTSSFNLGQLVAHGLSEIEIINTMYDAALACRYVKDEGRAAAMATINSGLKAGIANPRPLPASTWDHTTDLVIPISDNISRAAPPIHATPYSWTNPTTIRRREWLYGRLLLRKFVSATISPGGIGKSSLIAAEALAMVSGKDLLGVMSDECLRVWLWNLEDPLEETQRKVQAAAIEYDLTPEDIGDRLMVDSGREQKLIIATTTRNGTVIVQPVVDSLVGEIIKHKIDVLMIDPFVSCHEVPENDNAAMDMVVKEWGCVAERGNCAIMLVHHTRKMGGADVEVTTESSRGGSSQTDACRVVRTINRMTKDQATNIGIENPRLYFRTINDKANLEPPVDKSDWYKLVSVDLGNGPMGQPGDSVGVVTKWEFPDALAGMTAADFAKIATVVRGGKWRFDPQAKDWVGKAVALALNLDMDDKPTKNRIKRMLGVWYKARSIKAVDGFDDKRKLRTFVEVAEED